jgi:hypothetical protein
MPYKNDDGTVLPKLKPPTPQTSHAVDRAPVPFIARRPRKKRHGGGAPGKQCATCRHPKKDQIEGALLCEWRTHVSRACGIDDEALRKHERLHMTKYPKEKLLELREAYLVIRRQRDAALEEKRQRQHAEMEAMRVELMGMRAANILEKRIINGTKSLQDADTVTRSVLATLMAPIKCPHCEGVVRVPKEGSEKLALEAVARLEAQATIQFRVDGRIRSTNLIGQQINQGAQNVNVVFQSADWIAFRNFILANIGSCCRASLTNALRERAALPEAQPEMTKNEIENGAVTLDASAIETAVSV